MNLVCEHKGTGTVYNLERGVVFKADCGSRARCPAARRRWRAGMRERLSLVKYFRAPDLWTFTVRTAEQDAIYQLGVMMRRAALGRASASRRDGPASAASMGQPDGLATERGSGRSHKARSPKARAPLVPEDASLIDGRDRGAATKQNIAIMNTGLERVVRRITRQFERQTEPGYMRSLHARKLHAKYGTARPVRGRPGAALHIRVREVGELHGRIHAHVASDFDYLLHAWLDDTCLACGLGHPQFERKESRVMHAASRFSGPHVRSETIGHYLAKYLSTSADDAPWPWPAHVRLVSAGLRRKLPPRVAKLGYSFSWLPVALVAVDLLGATCVDADATFYSRDTDPARAPPESARAA